MEQEGDGEREQALDGDGRRYPVGKGMLKK